MSGDGVPPGVEPTLPEGYEALRRGVGAYRLPVDVVAVSGRDATSYLQGQLSQDVAPLAVGDAAPALLLEPDGKLTALVRVLRTDQDAYVLDTDAGFGATVADRLRKFKLRTKVDIEPLDWSCVALRGNGVVGARSGEGSAPPPPLAPPFAVAVDWNGTHGLDLLGPGAGTRVPDSAVLCDAAAWEAVRVEAGIPKMGTELDARTIAAEAGLVQRAVSFTKGCYTGQELVARLDARGNRVARRLVGLVVEEARPDEAALLVGASLWAPGMDKADKPVGRCTSAAWCPGLGEHGAVGVLAYLHRSVEVPAPVLWAPDGRAAEARALPLVG